MNSKYYREHQHACDILMFIYLMASKLFYVIMDWVTFNPNMTEIPIIKNQSMICSAKRFLYDRDLRREKFNKFHALEQGSSVIRALQSAMMILLTKIVSNVNLKTLTILTKRLILVA